MTPEIRAIDGTTFRYVACDASGRLIVTTAAAAPVTIVEADATMYDSAGVATSALVVGSAARVLAALVRNDAAANRFFMLFNAAASPPANGTRPTLQPIRLAPGQEASLVMSPTLFGTGIVWASSTSDDTLTITGAADMRVTIWRRA